MSRVLKPFEYFEPATLEEAVPLLQSPGAYVLAGGVELLLKLRTRQLKASRIVNLQKISELDYVDVDGNGVLHVGAMASMQKVAEHPQVKSNWAALAEGNAVLTT